MTAEAIAKCGRRGKRNRKYRRALSQFVHAATMRSSFSSSWKDARRWEQRCEQAAVTIGKATHKSTDATLVALLAGLLLAEIDKVQDSLGLPRFGPPGRVGFEERSES